MTIEKIYEAPWRKRAPYSPVRFNRIVVRYPRTENKGTNEEMRKTRMRVDRTGVLSTQQYRFIWGEPPAIGKYVRVLTPVAVHLKQNNPKSWKGIQDIKWLPQFRRLFFTDMLYGKSPDLHRLLHDFTNVYGAFYFAKKMGVKPSSILYDWETNIMVPIPEEHYGCKHLHPDAVIAKGNRIVFLETDMGTHQYSTLYDKAELYRKFFETGVLQKMWYEKISVVMYSFEKHLAYIKRKGCMEPIASYVEYFDFLDNPYNLFGDPCWLGKDFGDYEKAIRRAKKSWSNDMLIQWGEKCKYKFRDPEEFEEQVIHLMDPLLCTKRKLPRN